MVVSRKLAGMVVRGGKCGSRIGGRWGCIGDRRGRCGVNGTIVGESGKGKERDGTLGNGSVLVGNGNR